MEETLEQSEKRAGSVPSKVRARVRIEQSPLHDDSAVPRGCAGDVVDCDYIDNHIYVDFGDHYGVVLCDYCELSW